MGFYDKAENVAKYIDMCTDYDGSNIYPLLTENLKAGSSLLELGSGPGLDIPFLDKHYRVTGSDFSDEFLKHCRHQYKDIPFIKVNALEMDLSENFDCIYSNKVLHHFTEAALLDSLIKQSERLNKGGVIAHSFWIGEENKEMHDLLFTYYSQNELFDIISEKFELIASLSYQEFEEADSLFIIAKLKAKLKAKS